MPVCRYTASRYNCFFNGQIFSQKLDSLAANSVFNMTIPLILLLLLIGITASNTENSQTTVAPFSPHSQKKSFFSKVLSAFCPRPLTNFLCSRGFFKVAFNFNIFCLLPIIISIFIFSNIVIYGPVMFATPLQRQNRL